jgi:hypothetical protein
MFCFPVFFISVITGFRVPGDYDCPAEDPQEFYCHRSRSIVLLPSFFFFFFFVFFL